MTGSPISPVELRPGREDDVEALAELGREVWPTAYAFSPGAAEHTLATWWTPEALRRSLGVTRWVVAERDGRVVGAGNVDLHPDVPVVWILAVLPAEQGLGTGTALLDSLGHTSGGGALRLSYLEGNDPAAASYAARGFREVGRTPADGPNPPEVVVQRG